MFLEPSAIFPVPFRWFFYLAKAVYKCKKNRFQDLSEEEKEKKKEKERKYFCEKDKKYFCLLRQLILIQQALDLEQSSEDRIADLRQDILNELRNLKQK